MAVTRAIHPSETMGIGSIPMLWQLEGASETFKRGCPIGRGASSSAGYLVANGTGSAGTILGVAMEDGHNTSRGLYTMPYVPALPHILFEGQVHHATSASAAKIQQSDMGSSFGLALTSAGKSYINKADISAPQITIVDFIDPVGTTNGRVKFLFKINYTPFSRT